MSAQEPKKKKRPRDLNALASMIVEEATEEEELAPPEESDAEKNPHAVELGRLGGLVGGKRRAEKLTPEERSEIAKRAALARWNKRRKETP